MVHNNNYMTSRALIIVRAGQIDVNRIFTHLHKLKGVQNRLIFYKNTHFHYFTDYRSN